MLPGFAADVCKGRYELRLVFEIPDGPSIL